MKRLAALALAAGLVGLAAVPVAAYLKLGTRVGSQTLTLKWPRMPVRYFVSDRSADNVTAAQLQAAVAKAFGTWDALPTARLSSEFVGFTAATPRLGDSLTVLGFQSRPDLERVLGATSFIIDTVTGDIVESDIFFNTAAAWSVASGGEPGRYDLESIAVHEIGHLHGLGHSALGETELRAGGRRVLGSEAVMFPIAFSSGSIQGRTLKQDDIAGMSDIYPSPEFTAGRGSISGKVTKNGKGLLGAHVVAFNPRTGHLIGGFTLNADGNFVLAGLEPGPQVLRAEPLDDGDIESFFDTTLDIDVDFKVKFYERLVVVPRGGGARDVEIKVVAK